MSCALFTPIIDNLSLSGSLKLNRTDSFNAQKRASIATTPLTGSSFLSPVSDAPLTSVSVARHFELPVVMEEDEKSEGVDVKRTKEISLDNKSCTQEEDKVFSLPNKRILVDIDDQQHMDASTQTSSSKGGGDDEDLVNIVMRDVLYKYIPLPPSTTTTPSVSHCNLENY